MNDFESKKASAMENGAHVSRVAAQAAQEHRKMTTSPASMFHRARVRRLHHTPAVPDPGPPELRFE